MWNWLPQPVIKKDTSVAGREITQQKVMQNDGVTLNTYPLAKILYARWATSVNWKCVRELLSLPKTSDKNRLLMTPEGITVLYSCCKMWEYQLLSSCHVQTSQLLAPFLWWVKQSLNMYILIYMEFVTLWEIDIEI